MRDSVDPIRKRKAELIAVGNGSARQAKAFHEEQEMSFRLLTDPSLRTYRASGFKSGILTTATPGTVKRGLKAIAGGFLQGRTKGAPFQQGGALVIAPGGKELYRYVSAEAGDHPAPADLLAALP